MSANSRRQATISRHKRIRKGMSGTPERPRLAIYRSNNHIVAQVIDDVAQHTLVAASTLESDVRESLSATANSTSIMEESKLSLKLLAKQVSISKSSSSESVDRNKYG
jgi:ribosomal protein L18